MMPASSSSPFLVSLSGMRKKRFRPQAAGVQGEPDQENRQNFYEIWQHVEPRANADIEGCEEDNDASVLPDALPESDAERASFS